MNGSVVALAQETLTPEFLTNFALARRADGASVRKTAACRPPIPVNSLARLASRPNGPQRHSGFFAIVLLSAFGGGLISHSIAQFTGPKPVSFQKASAPGPRHHPAEKGLKRSFPAPQNLLSPTQLRYRWI
jgi:hypothetical protein